MEIPLAELQRNLKTVRLHGMSATLETRLVQASQGASFAEVFSALCRTKWTGETHGSLRPGSKPPVFQTGRL